MTPAQKALSKGNNVSHTKRGVSVVLQPAVNNTTALVEEVTEKSRQRLQVRDAAVTHVLHVKQSEIARLTVDLDAVAEIDRGDSEQTYRVQYFVNDPQKFNIQFHCAAA